jgi:hypothetical protein
MTSMAFGARLGRDGGRMGFARSPIELAANRERELLERSIHATNDPSLPNNKLRI